MSSLLSRIHHAFCSSQDSKPLDGRGGTAVVFRIPTGYDDYNNTQEVATKAPRYRASLYVPSLPLS